jgi:hypothetical protein
MTDEPIITPHPEVESLSNVELRHALANADERLELLHKLPPEDRDPMVEAWLVQERQLILAELRRPDMPTQAPQTAVNNSLTSLPTIEPFIGS